MSYSTNGTNWTPYVGSTVLTAAQIGGTGDYYLCFRGERNTRISSYSAWVITGSSVVCSGSIENLRDYTGEKPMGLYWYAFMFSGCTALETAPSLPATTSFEGCYNSMFNSCTGIKLYENAAAVGGVSAEWAIPAAANAEGLQRRNHMGQHGVFIHRRFTGNMESHDTAIRKRFSRGLDL